MFLKWAVAVSLADEEAGRCLDHERNGVNQRGGGGGNGGGPVPPSGEQDKQLISSRGGGTLMEQPGRLEDESSVATRTHCAQST
jgi:hypothetical protein